MNQTAYEKPDRAPGLIGARGQAIKPSAIEEAAGAIASAGAGIISLADGTPPAEELPSGEIATALMAAIREPDALDYGAPRGEPELLQAIDEFLDTLGAPPRHSIVTSGATQGLFLALHVLASPGDTVLADAATYCDALTACATLQLRVVGVPDDDEGMVPEALDAAIVAETSRGCRPAAIYLIPTAHNPLGITLPSARRRALADVARAHGVAIVEDDTYVLFDSAPAPPLAALAPELVVRLDSLSKLLGPGLRIGWVSGPPDVMVAMEQLKAAVDVCATIAIQRAVARLLPDIRALADRQMAGLALRRAGLLAALEEHFGGQHRWTRPRGGYFVWLNPSVKRPAREVAARALAAGVAVLPGGTFSPDGRDDALRLSCANRTPAEIHEGVARLRTALVVDS